MKTFFEITEELKRRGEEILSTNEDAGTIYTKHGMHTFNTWAIIDDELTCIDTKSTIVEMYQAKNKH